MRRILMVLVTTAVVGCVESPVEDGAPPVVEVTFLRAAGTPLVRSTELLEPPEDCAYTVGPEPWRVLVTALDPGGLSRFGARIPFGSGVVTSFAPSPGATATVTPTGAGAVVTVAIEPRDDGLVQTRADVTVDVSGSLPLDVRGWAEDLAGSYAETQQFALHPRPDASGGVICGRQPDTD